MEIIKYQKFYVRSLYKSNKEDDINIITSLFKTNINIKFKLTKNDFYKEKYKVFGNINKLDLDKICEKLSNDDIKVNIKKLDVF